MGLFFVYILKSSVCLAGFYLFYRLLLSKETFHRFNRMALLGLLVLSCLIPFVEVTVKEPSEVALPFLSMEEMLMMAGQVETGAMEEAVPVFPWREWLLVGYWVGILFFLLRHLWSLGRMLRLLGRCQRKVMENGIILYTHHEKVAPFSWMKAIVISEEDLEENGDAILKHEYAHIRNRHSWDLLLAEVCIFFQWFNPAAWLLKQELQNIHEYEADEWVISQGIDAKRYQLLIIKKAVGARLYSIANSFNHSSLKKRITMMIKKKSNPWARMKYLYVLPLAAIAIAAFARPEVSNELNEISSVKVNDLASIMKTDEVKSVENSSEEKFKLSGQVMSANTKKPVIGASIVVRGTTNGTLSDADGKFELQVKKDDVLMVSYIGLQTQSLLVAGQANLVVWMKDDVQSMEEMLVVGMAQDGVGAKSADPNKKVVQVVEVPNDKPVIQEGEIFTVVEEMPQFPGGMGEAMKFLAQNIKYPAVAQQAKIEGRVIVQFLVKENGKVADIKVMRGVSPELDAEAMRVVGLMPDWIPGKQRGKAVAVKYTMPIMFRLQDQEPKKEAFQHINLKVDKEANQANVDVAKNYLRTRGDENSSLVYAVVVDGKEIGMGAQALQKVPVETIEHMEVLSAKNAMAKYGEKSKDGAIEIKTRKK